MNFELRAPEAKAPSIASSAMLVELSISVWTGHKKDKRASADVTAQNHAKKGAASVNKKLLADCPELVAIQKFAAHARQSNYASTIPWSDSGLRLLPTARYFDYHKQMTGMKAEFEQLVEKFLAAYSWEVQQAQTSLGNLFVADDYPTEATLRNKFAMRINYIPVPEQDDWRVDIDNQAKDALRAQYESFYSTQVAKGMGDLWSRLHEQLERLITQLDVSSDGKKGRVYQSTIDAVGNLTDMLGALNFNNDPTMQLAERKLRAALSGSDQKTLSGNMAERLQTKKNLEAAIKALPTIGW